MQVPTFVYGKSMSDHMNRILLFYRESSIENKMDLIQNLFNLSDRSLTRCHFSVQRYSNTFCLPLEIPMGKYDKLILISFILFNYQA